MARPVHNLSRADPESARIGAQKRLGRAWNNPLHRSGFDGRGNRRQLIGPPPRATTGSEGGERWRDGALFTAANRRPARLNERQRAFAILERVEHEQAYAA